MPKPKKKLLSIRVTSETTDQINRLKSKKMDDTTQAAVVARAVELYFNQRVDAEMAKLLRSIPFETMEKGKDYCFRVNNDGTIEAITQGTGEGGRE